MKQSVWLGSLVLLLASVAAAQDLERVEYNHPGLVVDLGVGLYAFPMPYDADSDGDLDLLISCSDKPYNGTYLFENPGSKDGEVIFRPGKRLGPGKTYTTLSLVAGKPRLLSSNREHVKFLAGDLQTTEPIYPRDRLADIKHMRNNVWRLVDYDGDGDSDLLVGQESWDDYGWFDTNDWWKRYDKQGRWTGGKLHGWVFWIRNEATDAEPRWGKPEQLHAASEPIDVYGWPCPNLADFDGDGDLDLICGEFLDRFTYFENTGTRQTPKFAAGRRLVHEGLFLTMDLQMINPATVDWDRDGDVDLVVGDEDGRVALIEQRGSAVEHLPQFEPPRYLRQQAHEVKFGALATPCGFDWDGDGDDDILCGNTAGYLGLIENLSGRGVERPKFAAPLLLKADDEVIRIQAGPSGSIQGPCEAKWGYTTLSVADWDHDGLPDLVVNSIWGQVQWHRNIGTRVKPRLAAARPVEVEWPGEPPKPEYNWWDPQGKELVTQWRTTPVAVDWTSDGLVDLVMLDTQGYLALYERTKRGDHLSLLPPQRVMCDEAGQPLRLNAAAGGRSGRRKLCVTDWDGDGRLDLLVNSANATWLRQVKRDDGKWHFEDRGKLAKQNIEAHDVSPTTVDWNGDGIPDLLAGGEDGHLYYLRNERSAR